MPTLWEVCNLATVRFISLEEKKNQLCSCHLIQNRLYFFFLKSVKLKYKYSVETKHFLGDEIALRVIALQYCSNDLNNVALCFPESMWHNDIHMALSLKGNRFSDKKDRITQKCLYCKILKCSNIDFYARNYHYVMKLLPVICLSD